jgi:Domain of unknown function (DUF3291)
MPAQAADEFQLAQVNVLRMREPLDSEATADFVALLAPINAIAERSPGYVWRLKTDEGDATQIRAFNDDHILINLSVWRSEQELWDFAYASRHLDVMRRRREWHRRIAAPNQALWWVEAGQFPTVEDAAARLELIRMHGPTPEAFTFRDPFPRPRVLHKRSNGVRPAHHLDSEGTAGFGGVLASPTRPLAR